jgi:hypothetical protein
LIRTKLAAHFVLRGNGAFLSSVVRFGRRGPQSRFFFIQKASDLVYQLHQPLMILLNRCLLTKIHPMRFVFHGRFIPLGTAGRHPTIWARGKPCASCGEYRIAHPQQRSIRHHKFAGPMRLKARLACRKLTFFTRRSAISLRLAGSRSLSRLFLYTSQFSPDPSPQERVCSTTR